MATFVTFFTLNQSYWLLWELFFHSHESADNWASNRTLEISEKWGPVSVLFVPCVRIKAAAINGLTAATSLWWCTEYRKCTKCNICTKECTKNCTNCRNSSKFRLRPRFSLMWSDCTEIARLLGFVRGRSFYMRTREMLLFYNVFWKEETLATIY